MTFLNKIKNSFSNNSVDVSVIIPAYNYEKYIDKALESVCNQTLENIEIICVDDASSDNTLDIINKYAKNDNRIQVICNESNMGLGMSRNKALDSSCGKYITFLDADDWLDENTLEYTFNKVIENNLELLLFKLINFDDDKKTFYKNDTYSMNFLDRFIGTVFSHEDIAADTLFNIPVTAPGKLYLRSFLLNNKLRFMKDTVYEDNPFFIETFLKAERVSIVDKFFYKRRIHSTSIMQGNSRKLIDMVGILDSILHILRSDESIYEKYKVSFYNFMIHSIMDRFFKIDSEFKNDYFVCTKNFIEKCIVDYKLHDDISSNLSKTYLHFYNLIIKSIDSKNNIIKSIQEDITLNSSIASIVYCDDITISRLNEMLDSFINQSMGFSYLEVIFINSIRTQSNVKKLLTSYANIYHNIKYIQLDDDLSLIDAYYMGIKDTKCPYITLIDKNHIYKNYVLKNLFVNINGNKLNMAYTNITDYNSKTPELEIHTKIFTRKFLLNSDEIFLKAENGKYLINPKAYTKRDVETTEDLNVIELIYFMLPYYDTNRNTFEKRINFMIEILKDKFLKIDALYKNDCIKQIQLLIKKCIIDYNMHEVILKNIKKENIQFYEYILQTLSSRNAKIRKIKENLNEDRPITIIVACSNYTHIELNEILDNLINQSIGFPLLKVLFINNTENEEIRYVIKEYAELYPNVECKEIKEDTVQLYNHIINDIDTQYVMFYNNKHPYLKTSVKNIFRTVRKGNMHIASGIIENTDDDGSNHLIWTKIFKTKFIKEKNIKFYENENHEILVEKKIFTQKGIVNVDIPVTH